ncbi:MAG: GbsR/MarR family transcriptional regulator [Nannocystaceae bacterium]
MALPSTHETAATPDHLERRILQVCNAIGEFIAYWGFKSIHGRIWTLLALHREPQTQVGIAQALGVSRSLVSGSISELQRYGLVRPISTHRNAPFEAVVDVWPTIADILRTREWMLIESARLALEAAIDEVEIGSAEVRKTYDLERLRLLLAMTQSAQTVLKLLLRMRNPPSSDSLRLWLGKLNGLIGRLRTPW